MRMVDGGVVVVGVGSSGGNVGGCVDGYIGGSVDGSIGGCAGDGISGWVVVFIGCSWG